MNPAQIEAVYRFIFGPGPGQPFDMSTAGMEAALLARYPLAANLEDIFTRNDQSPEVRLEAYAMFGVAP